MEKETVNLSSRARALWIMAMVNVSIWAIAIIAMVFVMQHSPGAKKLFPILASGSAVGIAMISSIGKLR